MSNLFLIIFVLVIGLGGLFGVAWFLDRRGRKAREAQLLPKPGPIGRILLWIARILILLCILSVIGAFLFQSKELVWFAGDCLMLYIVDGILYRIFLASGR
jgi:hypothetical protein